MTSNYNVNKIVVCEFVSPDIGAICLQKVHPRTTDAYCYNLVNGVHQISCKTLSSHYSLTYCRGFNCYQYKCVSIHVSICYPYSKYMYSNRGFVKKR